MAEFKRLPVDVHRRRRHRSLHCAPPVLKRDAEQTRCCSGDISSLNPDPCACGRTHARMSRVSRHTDNRIVVRGINILPTQVEAALAEVPGLGPECQLVIDRTTALERLEIHVELSPESMPDQMGRLVRFESRVKQKMQETIGLAAEVKLVEPAAIPPGAPRIKVIEKKAGQGT